MRTWNSLDLLKNVNRQSVKKEDAELIEFRDFFWKDLCAEFDSINLYIQIQSRRNQYSADFLSFVDLWYRDELNHALGFARIYEILYGTPISELWRNLQSRQDDFSLLQSYLDDEFKLLCLLSYDELATTHTYHKDVEFYKAFGLRELDTWIARIKMDEARHFTNAMKLIRKNHGDRISEVQEVMEDVLRIDLSNDRYRSTFVLDHSADCVHFQLDGSELTEKCARVIVNKLTANAEEQVTC